MQFCAKPEKKDDYTTTNHTGVNGPTGPITPKDLRSIYPTSKFYVICIKYNIFHALYSNFNLYPSKVILKHLPSVQYSIIFNAIGHIS